MLKINKFWFRTTCVGCAFSVVFFATNASALVLIQDASVAFGTDFDSNPQMTDDKQSLQRYFITPRYSISAYDNQDRWYSNASLRIQRSSDKQLAVDREDPTINIGWEREQDKGRLSVFTSYVKNSTRITEFDGTGLVVSDGASVTRSIGANWQRFITDKINFTLGGQYLKTDFSGGGNFTNFSTKSLNSSINYALSDRINPYVQVGYTEFNTDTVGSEVTKSQSYLAGANFVITPRLNINAGYGITHISAIGNGKNINSGLSYLGERYQLRGAVARSVSPSAIGRFQESDRLTLAYGYDLSEKSRLGADFTWRINNTLNSVRTKQLTSFYARDLSDYWQMRLSLQFRELESDNVNTNGETLGLSLTYNTPEF